MIARYDIIQGTFEWHEIKWRKIGGTLSNGLFNKSEALFIDLLSQFDEEFEPEDSFSNYHMERGTELEPEAREYLSQYLGIKFNNCGWLQCEENELLGISPDGISEDETVQCEIKCLSRKSHIEVRLNNQIPQKHISQCIHAFTVNPKLEELWFIAYRSEASGHFIEKLTRESLVDIGLTEEIKIPQVGKKGNPIKPKIEKRKVLVTVNYAVDIARKEADSLLKRIKETTFNTF